MSIQDMSIQQNATGVTILGGTAIALSSDGVEVKNGIHMADMSQADFTIRTNVTFRTRNPVRQPNGSYSKAKRFITVVVPKDVDGAGDISYNLVRIEVETHPKSTVAELTNLHLLGAQMLSDADVTSFLVNGSLK